MTSGGRDCGMQVVHRAKHACPERAVLCMGAAPAVDAGESGRPATCSPPLFTPLYLEVDARCLQDSDEDDTIANVPGPQAQREAWEDATAHHQHLQEGDTW